jgi:putative addiction module CopG family antidote
MRVELTSEQMQFVESSVASGRYPTQEALIADALRLLQHRDELRHAVQLGFDQIERGEGLDIDTDEELREFFDDIKREEPQQLERRSET